LGKQSASATEFAPSSGALQQEQLRDPMEAGGGVTECEAHSVVVVGPWYGSGKDALGPRIAPSWPAEEAKSRREACWRKAGQWAPSRSLELFYFFVRNAHSIAFPHQYCLLEERRAVERRAQYARRCGPLAAQPWRTRNISGQTDDRQGSPYCDSMTSTRHQRAASPASAARGCEMEQQPQASRQTV